MADRGEHALDRVRGAQVVPVLGREIVEGKQGLGVLGQAGHRAGIFDTVFFLEGLDGGQRGGSGFSAMDIPQIGTHARLHGFRKVVDHVRNLVEPAPLVACAGKDLLEGLPEAQSTIPDGQLRGNGQAHGP